MNKPNNSVNITKNHTQRAEQIINRVTTPLERQRLVTKRSTTSAENSKTRTSTRSIAFSDQRSGTHSKPSVRSNKHLPDRTT